MNLTCTMKNLPCSEQPYERCMESGPAILSDAELLAVIIRNGYQGKSALAIAHALLAPDGERQGLPALTHRSISQLTKIQGIGTVKAIQLQCIGELAKRIAKANARNGLILSSPSAIAEYFMEEMRHMEQEEMHMAMFNTKSRLIKASVVSKGTVNASLITPREVFLEAFRHQAVFVVLIHNHPSGDPQPSREDLLLTKRMRDAGDLLEIPVMDHIVIGDNRYISFKERGYF